MNKFLGILYTLLATVGTVLFGASQGILIPILIDNFKNALGSPYFLLITSSFFFVIIFGVVFVIYKIFEKKKSYTCYSIKQHILFVLTGTFDAFTGIFLIYASDATRTPIVLQSILSGCTIFITITISKRLIKSKRKIKFINIYVIISLILLFISIIISIIPQFTNSVWKWTDFFWIFIFLIGMVCRGTYNTFQEKYIEITKNTIGNQITVLFWTCFYQFFVIIFMVWLDIIPFFGYSKITEFGSNFINFYTCYIPIHCSPIILLLGLGFVVGYSGSYVCAIYLNAESANYSMLATSLVSPSVILFFELFPSLNSGIKYPLYFTIPAIILNILSLVIWNFWEIVIVKKSKNKNNQNNSTINSKESIIKKVVNRPSRICSQDSPLLLGEV